MWLPIGPRKAEGRLLEELAKLVSPGPEVGAAKLEEEEETAKVARRMEEPEGNFMIKKKDGGWKCG